MLKQYIEFGKQGVNMSIKMLFSCDKCGVGVERTIEQLPTPAAWDLNVPTGWETCDIGKFIVLCDKCKTTLLDKQVELQAAQDKFRVDVDSYVKAK